MHTISKYLLSSYFTSKINLGWLSRLIYSVTHYIMHPIVVTHIIVRSFPKKVKGPWLIYQLFSKQMRKLYKKKTFNDQNGKVFLRQKCNIVIKKIRKFKLDFFSLPIQFYCIGYLSPIS